MKNKKENPRYPHDCNRCVFLGYHGKYDLYVCIGKVSISTTIIARYGIEGDYYSGLPFRLVNKPLGIAFKRACERGLLKEEDCSPAPFKCKCGYFREGKPEDECCMCKIKG